MSCSAATISVLVVEDEAIISSMVADALSEYGFAVHEAATGSEALRYLDSGIEVDVLFTDINLPGGIDGTELACLVRAMRPELPVIYTSGRYQPSGPDRMVPRSTFVPKPYNPDQICRLLDRMTNA